MNFFTQRRITKQIIHSDLRTRKLICQLQWPLTLRISFANLRLRRCTCTLAFHIKWSKIMFLSKKGQFYMIRLLQSCQFLGLNIYVEHRVVEVKVSSLATWTWYVDRSWLLHVTKKCKSLFFMLTRNSLHSSRKQRMILRCLFQGEQVGYLRVPPPHNVDNTYWKWY